MFIYRFSLARQSYTNIPGIDTRAWRIGLRIPGDEKVIKMRMYLSLDDVRPFIKLVKL